MLRGADTNIETCLVRMSGALEVGDLGLVQHSTDLGAAHWSDAIANKTASKERLTGKQT